MPVDVPRRTVISASVAGSAAVVLAACASEPEVAKTTPPSATVEDSGESLSGEVLLGLAADVPVGGGTKFKLSDELTVLVTQPRAGEFRAFSATCTHAGCIVTGVQEEQIACGCHGARFNTDSGEPESGPAKAALGKIQLEVRGAELYATI
jgi:Rieske Fe-S protein